MIRMTKIIKTAAAAGAAICAAAVLQAASALTGYAGLSIDAYAVTIEYDNLRTLLVDGNPELKYNSYFTNVANVEHQLEVMREECQNLAMLSKLYRGDSEHSSYAETANALNKTINRLEKQLERLKSESASINKVIDMLTISAQTSMISYLQAEANAAAAEKEAAAAEVKYSNTVTRQSAGAATESEVIQAHADMLNAQARSDGLRQQAASDRSSFLKMLGIADDGTVVFAEVPAPDLEAIAAVNFEEDMQTAVNSDPDVISARHRRSDSSAAMQIKSDSEEVAVANAMNEYAAAYTELQARVEDYKAAEGALRATEQTWAGVQRKKAAGMLTEADYLTAEARYISSKADFDTAQMSLKNTWDTYCWQLKGTL